MTVAGGILGGCAITLHFQFGSAQTNNILLMIAAALAVNLGEVLLRLAALFIYVGGLSFCTYLKCKFKFDLRLKAICFEIIVLLMTGFLPPPPHHLIALFPYFLVTSVQWSFFAGIKEYPCSSIFITNNLRICVSEIAEFVYDRDVSHLIKSRFYAVSIGWYFLGVTSVFLTVPLLGSRSLLLCTLPLSSALLNICSINKVLPDN